MISVLKGKLVYDCVRLESTFLVPTYLSVILIAYEHLNV